MARNLGKLEILFVLSGEVGRAANCVNESIVIKLTAYQYNQHNVGLGQITALSCQVITISTINNLLHSDELNKVAYALLWQIQLPM